MRYSYSETIKNFISEDESSILGKLFDNHSNRTVVDLQKNAWKKQIELLKHQLSTFKGQVYFEFAIPRMGKKVDNIVIIQDIIFIIEFKVGLDNYDKHAIEQVIDYTIDLKNFHEGSHDTRLIPILVATNALDHVNTNSSILNYETSGKANKENLRVASQEFFLQ